MEKVLILKLMMCPVNENSNKTKNLPAELEFARKAVQL